MTSTALLKTRAKLLRQQLAQIDERLVSGPTPHPFAGNIAKGPSALPDLLRLIERSDLDIADRLLAIQAVSAIVTQHGEHPDVTCLLISIGTAPDQHPSLRAAAGRGLLISKNEAFTASFEVRLASPEPRIAAAAAKAMGVARRSQAVEALIELFAHSESPTVQSQAAWALGEIGDSRALEILHAAFKAERCLVPVIEALGKLGGDETLAYLTVALQDSLVDIRLTTAEAIYALMTRHPELDHQSLVSYLTDALTSETDGQVGIILISCLARLGAPIPKELIQKTLTSTIRKGSIKSAAMGQTALSV